MIITRKWAMPNKWTFEIPPIRKLIYKYGGDFKGWIDPFSGSNSPAEIRNDINPDMPAEFNLEAEEFVKQVDNNRSGGLFDPPYSYRQVKEHYEFIGKKATKLDTSTNFYGRVKNPMANKIKLGGYAICCGWNSNGFGKKRGFELIELLVVAHGTEHNDTLVTVERKFQEGLFNEQSNVHK